MRSTPAADPLGLGRTPAESVFDQMVDYRRSIHRHPELAFLEHRTTALIRQHMADLGADEPMAVGDTGGIWVLEGAQPGRTVVLRADIDALPVQEDLTRAVHSDVDGVMHACGHDIHASALLGTATLLAARRDELRGRYVFVFQPAEEALCGAKSMIERGALSVMEGASLIGFHVSSLIPTGYVAMAAGIAMSEAHSIEFALHGPGGHGAMPTGEGDVVRAASALVSRLPEAVEGLVYEGTPCVCSAGTLRAGTAVNVVPTEARVTGTLRTFTDAQREDAKGRLGDLCVAIGESFGVHVVVSFPESTRAVVNDPAVTDLVESQAAAVVGSERVLRLPPLGPSDDVAEFLAHVPGCYFFVGGGSRDGSTGMHHSPSFGVEDGALRMGASVLARSAVALGAAEP
jgi:amidohydrolase